MLSRFKTAIQLCLCLVIFFAFLGFMYHHQNVASVPSKLSAHASSSDRTSQQNHQPISPGYNPSWTPPEPPVKPDADFKYNVAEHGSDFGLGRAQCYAAFPKMFKEVDRARAYWTGEEIAPLQLDTSWKKHGLVRVRIHNKRLYVIDAKYSGNGYNIHRSLALLSAINRALVATSEAIPNVEFTFSVNDVADPEGQSGRKPIWTLSRRVTDKHQWVMSDFGYWSWGLDLVGEYSQIRAAINATEPSWRDKKDKALWRGAIVTQVRQALLDVAAPYLASWADVLPVTWSARTSLTKGSRQKALSIPQHCKYKYLIHTEGVSYSGRGKYLQNCRSVVVMHARDWIENYDHLLVQSGYGISDGRTTNGTGEGVNQNVVAVQRDWADLPAKMEWLIANQAEAEAIAEESVRVFRDRYLTEAAQACYWREMMHAWRNVSFEPEVMEDIIVSNGGADISEGGGAARNKGRKVRGMPYETHMITAFDTFYSGCNWYKKVLGICA